MATAKLYDADLNPTKDELTARYSTITQHKGAYRAFDRDDKVGIEVLVGTDDEGNLAQCGFSYREEAMALDDALTPLEHSVLGTRSVAYLTADPVAVREFVQMIINGGEGADFSDGEPIFPVRGTGATGASGDASASGTEDAGNAAGASGGADGGGGASVGGAVVDDVVIDTHDKLNSVGTLTVNGEPKQFQLRLQRIIRDTPTAEADELALVRDDGAILMNLGIWD